MFDPSGRPLLKFGRVLVGRSSQLRINLKNNGMMAATARLDAAPHEHFSVQEPNQLYAVDSKRAQTFTVDFCPKAVGQFTHEVSVKVQRNPFEDYKVLLTGEGYQEDVTFDELPGNAVDELRLTDCPIGKPQQCVFVLRNHNAAKAFRFRWPATASPNLSFSPSTGHLLPGSTKDIMLTFKADAPVKMAPQEVKLNLVQVQHPEGSQPVDWDDRSTVLDYAAVGEDGQPTARPEPEPSVTDVAGTSKDMALKVFAIADNPRFEADRSAIVFKATTMFQTRSFAFPLKNTSSARMDFRFTVRSADGDTIDTSGVYTVSPEGGVVPPGDSATITVKFSPTEVEDCARTLVCEIPNLDAAAQPLVRPLDGKVLRPWCHFDLPASDYISGARCGRGLLCVGRCFCWQSSQPTRAQPHTFPSLPHILA